MLWKELLSSAYSRGRGRFSRKGSEGLEGQIGAGRHVCHDCGLTFETGQQLGGHRIVHKRPAGGNRFQCRTCGKGFDTLQALGGHQKIHQPAHRTKVQKDEQDAYGKVRPREAVGRRSTQAEADLMIIGSRLLQRWQLLPFSVAAFK
jgi:hypothetical protein